MSTRQIKHTFIWICLLYSKCNDCRIKKLAWFEISWFIYQYFHIVVLWNSGDAIETFQTFKVEYFSNSFNCKMTFFFLQKKVRHNFLRPGSVLHHQIYFFFICNWNDLKRKFKQWWSSIPPISSKRTIISHLNWTHWTQIKTTTYDVSNTGPGTIMWQG